MKKIKGVKVEQPEIEITLRADDAELAVIAFFSAGASEWDILVGIDDPSQRGAVAVALRTAAEAVESAAFRPIAPPSYERGDNAPPF